MGAGKSTFLNILMGYDEFETGDEEVSCTKDPKVLYSDLAKLWIMDLPGYGDPEMTDEVWL